MLWSALEKLVQDNPSYKGSGKLTQKMIRRLVSAARCAIKMKSTEANRSVGVMLLMRDVLNGPNQCFSNHSKCSSDFCSTVREKLTLIYNVDRT